MIHESRLLAVKALWNRLNGSEKRFLWRFLPGLGGDFVLLLVFFCVVYVAKESLVVVLLR